VVARRGVQRGAKASPAAGEGSGELARSAAVVLLVAEQGDRVRVQPRDQARRRRLMAGVARRGLDRGTGDVAGGGQRARAGRARRGAKILFEDDVPGWGRRGR